MTDPSAPTLAAAVAEALAAYDALAELGEEVEDEWSYVQDLSEAWRTRLDAVVGARGHEVLAQPTVAALARAAEEIGAIADPHRAIDWLSTFPQLVLVAVGETP